MPSSIRALLLDFDGTLVDSEHLHYDCWLQAVRPYGGHIEWPDYARRLVGITDREAGHILLSEAGQNPTEELVEEACRFKKSMYQSRFCQELTIEAEVCELVHKASATSSVGIVSSSLTIEVEPLLLMKGLRAALSLLVCGEHVTRRKPHPDPYLLALELLQQSEPNVAAEHCLVIEDSEAGVRAAEAAGMRVRRVESPSQLADALRDELGITV